MFSVLLFFFQFLFFFSFVCLCCVPLYYSCVSFLYFFLVVFSFLFSCFCLLFLFVFYGLLLFFGGGCFILLVVVFFLNFFVFYFILFLAFFCVFFGALWDGFVYSCLSISEWDIDRLVRHLCVMKVYFNCSKRLLTTNIIPKSYLFYLTYFRVLTFGRCIDTSDASHVPSGPAFPLYCIQYPTLIQHKASPPSCNSARNTVCSGH